MRTKEELSRKRRSAANRGQELQDALDEIHASYALGGSAYIVRTSAPMQITQRLAGGKFVAFFEGSGPPDYIGVAQGVAYLFDAKEHKGKALPLGAIVEHQARALDTAQDNGTVCGIVVDLPDLSAAWWVPWTRLGPTWWGWFGIKRAAPGTGSLDKDRLDDLGVRLLGLDWLPAAQMSMKEAA